jgi:hypothetical protein
MFNYSKRLLLVAAVPALVAGTLVMAQTAPAPDASAPEAAAPEQAVPETPRPVPTQFHGRRGAPHGFGGFGSMRDLFDETDADRDGKVTQEEVDAFRSAQLSGADADGDGAVSLEEFSTVYFERIRPMMVDAFQTFDDDGDGAITSAELDARFGDVVRRLDRDGDGALSLQDRGGRSGRAEHGKHR